MVPTIPAPVIRMYKGMEFQRVGNSDNQNKIWRSPSGRTVEFQEDLLPPPSDPNDLLSSSLRGKSSQGLASRLRNPLLFETQADEIPTHEDPFIRFGLQARPGVYYDTGFFNGSGFFSPSDIAVDGTAGVHRRGQLFFNNPDNSFQRTFVKLQTDIQTIKAPIVGQSQLHFDAVQLPDRDIQARNIYLRFIPEDQDEIAFGKTQSVFGDLDAVPPSAAALPAAPVGIVALPNFVGLNQLRYTRYWADGQQATIAIEDQSSLEDFSVTAGTRLNRWPTFVARYRFDGENRFDSFQIAGLVRPLGFEEADPAAAPILERPEHFATGWGLSAIVRWANDDKTDAFYGGVVGGRGIGGYIFGDITAAKLTDTSISTLSNLGAFAAYHRTWWRPDADHQLSSNFAYGFARGETRGFSDDSTNHKLHLASCNLIWNTNNSSAFGLEYLYGFREVANGKTGDDHRIMLVVNIGTSTSQDQPGRFEKMRDPSADAVPTDVAPSSGQRYLRRL